MSQKTRIEWTEYSWNPVTGCSKISDGCKNCYAEKMALRLKSMKNERYKNGFDITLQKDLLKIPFMWKKPRMVFVNSMSDLFHESIPVEYIKEVFIVMNQCPQHTFQILTKRSERLLELSSELNWTHNIWMGVSIENMKSKYRLSQLKKTKAKTKFISFEPLLEHVDINSLHGIDWVIVGGESGPKAREMKEEWAISLRDKCIEQHVPYFFKQWGGFYKKKKGRLLDGIEWSDMPKGKVDYNLSK
ncbi:MAG: Phage protein Gp37/Gp68 [Candidatus Methanofastidiosum methylothiophilum]|uniref:Phage protein Gp37/Gp68 n=1 Tax=Candidatus Methanofastidiosum methylothiophilum TaxID=1705564 RepID=A0A150IKD0_9EURY|nr:MAG: Phage protein Gp37/Gp68 [Candidatus Methanofastidiosum methylthiophilus]